MGKHGRARQNTDDNQCMHFACWMPKGTYTHSEYCNVILTDFRGNSDFVNAPNCHVCMYVYSLFCFSS